MMCPECAQGKHRNCDGVANLDERDQVIFCDCDSKDEHPLSDSPFHEDMDEIEEDSDKADAERIAKWEGN